MMCPKELSVDGYEMQLATNHLGPFLFTLLLLPRILKSAPARIVIVSSVGHKWFDGNMNFDDINYEKGGYSRTNAYFRSKYANVLFAKELAKRLEKYAYMHNSTGVTTYSLHPGVVNTELTRHMEEGYSLTMWLSKKAFGCFFKTPVEGAQTTLYCSLDEKCADETGQYYAECAKASPCLGSKGEEKGEKLWEESIRITQIDEANAFTPA